MPRAPKRCAKVGCKKLAPCPEHKVWQKSSGQRPLPANWKTIKKSAEGYAEKRCYVCNRIDPSGAVDHKVPRAQGGSDAPGNLGWICPRCHAPKTEAEKKAGRRRRA